MAVNDIRSETKSVFVAVAALDRRMRKIEKDSLSKRLRSLRLLSAVVTMVTAFMAGLLVFGIATAVGDAEFLSGFLAAALWPAQIAAAVALLILTSVYIRSEKRAILAEEDRLALLAERHPDGALFALIPGAVAASDNVIANASESE